MLASSVLHSEGRLPKPPGLWRPCPNLPKAQDSRQHGRPSPANLSLPDNGNTQPPALSSQTGKVLKVLPKCYSLHPFFCTMSSWGWRAASLPQAAKPEERDREVLAGAGNQVRTTQALRGGPRAIASLPGPAGEEYFKVGA